MAGVTKKEVLQLSNFGQRVAEEESQDLTTYFVETDQWRRMLEGEIDIVYGPKGSGKSAIYSLLLSRPAKLRKHGIDVIPAENPRGTLVFKDIVPDPPTSEREFQGLWKLYFLTLAANYLREQQASNSPSVKVISILESAGLLEREASLQGKLRAVRDYIRRLTKVESLEGGLQIDPHTGLPKGVTGKITLREPSAEDSKKGFISIDQMIILVDEGLQETGNKLWIAIDRLDVAFVDTPDLEENALKALFKVYLDMALISSLRLKIFLRSDIWGRLTKKGFREASHITRHITISWSRQLLLNLVIRRALRNVAIQEFYKVRESSVLANFSEQEKFFNMMLPGQVDVGSKKPSTFDWILTRTADGIGQTAPRELIHLLNVARAEQLKKYETGESEPENANLFSRSSLKDALPEVSKVRLEQTIYAEFPSLKHFIQALEGEKTEQTLASLARIWKVSSEDVKIKAEELVAIGVFQKRGTKEHPNFWVPFLYRDALNMIQGTADS
jgi:hypothetical protein